MKCEFAHMAENNPNFACIIKVSESFPSLSTSKQSKQQKKQTHNQAKQASLLKHSRVWNSLLQGTANAAYRGSEPTECINRNALWCRTGNTISGLETAGGWQIVHVILQAPTTATAREKDWARPCLWPHLLPALSSPPWAIPTLPSSLFPSTFLQVKIHLKRHMFNRFWPRKLSSDLQIPPKTY